MLHIHCGDTSADALRKSGVPGDVAVWSDPLMEGPLGADLPDAERRAVRAKHISAGTRGALPVEQAAGWLEKQDAALAKFAEHDEVVLWFDACLFDQLILIRQLDWFSRHDPGAARLSLICVGEYPGFSKFCGLGELLPHQLSGLFEKRHEVSAAETDLARRAWAAINSPDPTAIVDALHSDLRPLPYLGAALRRHLEQFPSQHNGLNRLENEVLEIVNAGHQKLVTIFVHVDHCEERPFFGDTTLWACMDRLARARQPVLWADGPGPLPLWNPPRRLDPWEVYVTDTGREVMAGRKDWITLNGMDRWLGGVHLTTGNIWRWDRKDNSLVKPGGK